MITITALWLPILLSAVIVFIMSSIIHMVLGYHKSDFTSLPSEEKVSEALREFNIPAGEYVIPKPHGSGDVKSPEYQEKLKKGPVAFMTFMPNGQSSMTGSLIQWFMYSIVVGIFVAYVTGRIYGPDANYLDVFRFSGTTAFLGYSLALVQNSIWYHRKWSTTFKNLVDGLIYALLTAGTFGWLWP
ncbi:MAG: hypothetical protein O2887_11730 [Bacteroidetes bacterium]|nr:hypothetical protein [Bacteroidota bacterium]MDA1121141.1 hypothetical protein [Bacteroidota bacterium]